MADLVFQESGLVFKFSEDWVVFKYDEHRFYLYLSGSGLKGVDFIAIRDGALFLIEAKNYRRRFEKENYDPMQALIEQPDFYVEAFSRKFEDTFRLLSVIDQYYQRKWWYRRFFLRFRSYFSEHQVLRTEVGFWSKANELVRQTTKVKLILWVEAEQKAIMAKYAYYQSAIQANFSREMIFQLAHQENPIKGMEVRVV